MMIKKIAIICAKILYSFFKLFPTQNKITMISRQSSNETLDFKLLREEIEKENLELYKTQQDKASMPIVADRKKESNNLEANNKKNIKPKKIKVKILCHKLEGGINAKFTEKMRYGIHMLSQMYNIATSKVVILDSYCILISILKHKKSLKVIQMWHSMGTMKKFGYQILDKEEGSKKEVADLMKMHKNYDYVFASSMAYAEQLAEGFGCELDKIRIYSLPRVDLLTSKEYKENISKKIQEKYPETETKKSKKKNILYCPTFRKNESILKKEIQKMIMQVDFNKYNLIIKLHPLSKIEIETSKAIFDKEFSSMDMLFIADYVISDYSCIIYEAAILNIPLFFLAFDLQEYINKRGLTIDYKKEVPGIVSKDAKEIIEAINSDKYNIEDVKQFRKKYVTNIKNCTEKIVEFVDKIMKE